MVGIVSRHPFWGGLRPRLRPPGKATDAPNENRAIRARRKGARSSRGPRREDDAVLHPWSDKGCQKQRLSFLGRGADGRADAKSSPPAVKVRRMYRRTFTAGGALLDRKRQ